MRHPIEICLTFCEWFETTRGRIAADRARNDAQPKTVWTFLAQGAVGGALGYFLMIVGLANIYPDDSFFALCFLLPLCLVFGAVFGTIQGFPIWLTGRLLKRRLNFFYRTIVVVCFMALLSEGMSYLTGFSQREALPVSWIVVFVAGFALPIVFMTGLRVRPGRLLVLGSGPRPSLYNFGSWLSVPAGIPLRLASLVGLLEALLVLAFWIANWRTGWLFVPAREYLPTIELAIIYFAASSYFSIRTPRKLFLLTIAVLLNAPLASYMIYLRHLDTTGSYLMSQVLLAQIWFWVIYTLGRLLAPEPARRGDALWLERNAAQGLSTNRVFQV